MSLRYPIGDSGQDLVIPDLAVRHFAQHAQARWFHREAGGQLFSRLEGEDIVVDLVTGPRKSDWRTRTSYRPNRSAERREIREQFAKGLHFIGDWHSHPEPRPTPSETDLLSVADCVQRSVHDLNGFVLIIVGQTPPPEGLYVSLHDGNVVAVLQAAAWASTQKPDAREVVIDDAANGRIFRNQDQTDGLRKAV